MCGLHTRKYGITFSVYVIHLRYSEDTPSRADVSSFP
jgi:hypothetical protein